MADDRYTGVHEHFRDEWNARLKRAWDFAQANRDHPALRTFAEQWNLPANWFDQPWNKRFPSIPTPDYWDEEWADADWAEGLSDEDLIAEVRRRGLRVD